MDRIQFRDIDELNQATQFLHDNGILLHYKDSSLSELYFLDPQWLCDMLAHVITIKEVNRWVKNGKTYTLLPQTVYSNTVFHSYNVYVFVVSRIV